MIVQNVTASIQISPGLLGRTAGDLFHPLLIRMSGDPRHTDPAAFQMKEEQHIVGHQARQLSTSTVKKSAPARTSLWTVIKSFHEVVWLRLGAGAMPWRRRMFPTV
jgi:hypothetical protein